MTLADRGHLRQVARISRTSRSASRKNDSACAGASKMIRRAGLAEAPWNPCTVLANQFRDKLELPSPPQTMEDLQRAPRALYERFEATTNLTKAALHTDLWHRMRETNARARWAAVRKLIDGLAPRRPERDRRIRAANIRYHLAASAWHYFRFYFGFSLDDSIAAAETAIRDTSDGLSRPRKPRALGARRITSSH
jgi:hypothetical protein